MRRQEQTAHPSRTGPRPAGVQAPCVAAVEARGSAGDGDVDLSNHVPAIIQKHPVLVQAPIAQFVRFSQYSLRDPAALAVVGVFQALARWSRPRASDGFGTFQ